MAKQLNEKTAKAPGTPSAGHAHRPSAATRDISALNQVLADVFALLPEDQEFHWHVSGPHFRDYHLLREQGDELSP